MEANNKMREEALRWAKENDIKIMRAAYEQYPHCLTEDDLIVELYKDAIDEAKALAWWNDCKYQDALCRLHFPGKFTRGLLSPEIVAIYKAEHPELNKGEGIEDDLDKDVAILEADLWNQPTGAPQVKEDIPEGDFLFFNWSKAPASNFNNRTNIMDGGDKIFVIEHYSDDKDKRTAIDTLLLSAPQLARNNKALISIVKELKQRNEELVKALEEVVRISDRKHDAWDKAKAALQQNK